MENGGLRAPHLESAIKIQRILCCKKFVNSQQSSWKTILLHYLRPVGGKLVLGCGFDIMALCGRQKSDKTFVLKDHIKLRSKAQEVLIDKAASKDIFYGVIRSKYETTPTAQTKYTEQYSSV